MLISSCLFFLFRVPLVPANLPGPASSSQGDPKEICSRTLPCLCWHVVRSTSRIRLLEPPKLKVRLFFCKFLLSPSLGKLSAAGHLHLPALHILRLISTVIHTTT